MTTAPVPSITEELLAELDSVASAVSDGEWFDAEGAMSCTGICRNDAEFIAAANPTTILALTAHIRSLEARLAYINRNFVAATFDYDGDGMAAMVVRISDRVSVCRDAMAVLDAAIAQEGQSHE